MEQLQFNDHFQGEGFDPVQQVDLTRTLDRKNARLNRADEEALAQVRRNNQVRIQNAQDSGDGLIALGKFSGKLSNLLGDIAKERKEEQDAEDLAKGLDLYRRGGLDMSDYNLQYDQAKEEAHVAADVEAGVLGDNGENYDASSLIGKSTAFSNVKQAEGFAIGALNEYGSFMEQLVKPEDYKDRASYISARRIASKEFARRAGLTGLPPQFLASTVYPKMIEVDARAVSAWSKQFAKDDSAIRQDEAANLISSDLDVTAFLDATRNTVDSNGKPLGYKGSWALFDQRITQALQAGILTATDVEIMKGQKIPGDSKGRTYGERYQARFAKMQRQVSAESRKIFQESEAERLTEFKQAEEDLRQAFLDSSDGDGFTDDQIDDAINTLRDRYGFESQELAVLKKNTVDAKTRKVQEEQIEGLMAMNLLTPERLKQFDPKLQKKYLSQAQTQANLRKENGDFKEIEEAIKDMVEAPTTVDGIVKNHPSVGLMVAKQKRRFHQLVSTYALAGEPDPANKALAQLMAEFKASDAFKDGGSLKSLSLPYPSAIPTFNPASQQANEREIARVNGVLKLGTNALDLPDDGMNVVLFNKPQLEAMEKGYGEEGWSPSPAVEYAADILDMDPLSLINKLRETNGMEALPATPAYEVIQNQLTSTQQRLLRQFKTPERTARGLVGQTQYNPELVPGGYGEIIADAASKENIDPSILAGLLDQESAYRPEVIDGTVPSSAGALGIAQIMTKYHPGVNPLNPEEAIFYAANYLRRLLDMFNGNYYLAITAYNAGEGNVQEFGGPIPDNIESQEYYGLVIEKAGKYGYGQRALSDPGTMRSSIQQQL